MKYILISFALLLSGCWTVPVAPDFPKLPEQTVMNIACPDLKALKSDPTISDISNTLNLNYHTYYECAVKVDSWNTWYRDQKALYEKTIKK
jgi:starvation-inducible outer membrane lipoprotein